MTERTGLNSVYWLRLPDAFSMTGTIVLVLNISVPAVRAVAPENNIKAEMMVEFRET